MKKGTVLHAPIRSDLAGLPKQPALINNAHLDKANNPDLSGDVNVE
jgi:hypothetical protein